MAKAMLNYGKYAKAYFDGEVLEATAEMNNVTADTLAEYKMSESGELPEGVIYYGSSLLLESKTVAVYAWNDAGNKWFDCADAGDGIHFVVKNFDFSYKNVIFCCMDPDKTENNWDNRLNATVDTVVPTGRNRYYRLDEGTLNNVGGSWISDSFLL